MNCNDARSALAADPRSDDRTLLDHLAGCDACAAYAADMHELDLELRKALEVPVPEIPLPAVPGDDVAPTQVPTPIRRTLHRATTRRYALAASLAGVALLVGVLWTAFPRESLASAVVGHMSHEPEAWTATASLPRSEVDAIMAASGLRLVADAPDVTYANSCWFRGRYVPHLVVRTAAGPVTVLVLPHHAVDRNVRIDEQGYRGELLPAPRGSIAVLERDGGDLQEVAERVLASIVYDGGTA